MMNAKLNDELLSLNATMYNASLTALTDGNIEEAQKLQKLADKLNKILIADAMGYYGGKRDGEEIPE